MRKEIMLNQPMEWFPVAVALSKRRKWKHQLDTKWQRDVDVVLSFAVVQSSEKGKETLFGQNISLSDKFCAVKSPGK